MSRKSEKPKPVSVYVRCRPRNTYEKTAGSHSIVECTKKEVIVKTNINKKYTFDHVYGPASSQVDLYKGVAASTVEEVLQGYNCTIFAYGQTGTGKTFTMEGNRSVGSNIPWQKDPSIGLIPRTMSHMFDRLNSQASDYSVRVSMMEMYNEELFDLLSSGDNSQKLRLFEDSTRKVTRGLGSVVIQGLEEVQVMSKDEVYNLMERAMQKRQTAETLLNKHSSRSHVVFTVTVHIKTVSQGDECEEEVFKMGKLNLVDLAGSENIGRSGAQNSRAREAGNINQSLLTLGRVITALVDRTPHVPYRESKLTRLLQDSLGGRTQTSIIATISPAHCNLEETLSTLDYANRAKNILNKPEVNQRSSKKTLIKEYTAEIDKLKRELLNSREKSGVYLEYDKFNEMEMRMKSQSQLIKDKEDELSSLIDARSKISSLFSNSIRQIDGLHKKIDRKERVESQNKTLINNYIQNTKNHYAMFSQYITERRETLRDRHDILCKSINSSKELGDEIHSQSSDSLNELIRTVAKSLSTALHQRDSQNEHWIEEYLTKELQPAIQSTVQYTTQLKQQYEAAHSSLIDIVKRDTELTNKKCDDMVAAIEYMITSVEKDLSKISDVIDDQYAFVEQSRKDQKAVVLETLAEGQVSLKKKMQEATQLLESFTELFDNKVRQRQIAVDNIHLQTTQVLNESKCEVKEQLKEISLNVHLGSKSLMDGHVQPLREQLLSQSQQVVGESEKNSEASKRKICELGVSMESVGERIKRMNTLCKEYHSSSAAQADIDHGTILTEGNQSPAQPHLRDIFNNRCKMEMLNSESMTAYRKHIQAIADNTTSLATCASEMCDETGGMVNESSARIQDLSEHVTEDLPTGATPKRAKLNRLVLHQNSGFNLDMIESDEENSDPNLSDPSLSMSFS